MTILLSGKLIRFLGSNRLQNTVYFNCEQDHTVALSVVYIYLQCAFYDATLNVFLVYATPRYDLQDHHLEGQGVYTGYR